MSDKTARFTTISRTVVYTLPPSTKCSLNRDFGDRPGRCSTYFHAHIISVHTMNNTMCSI